MKFIESVMEFFGENGLHIALLLLLIGVFFGAIKGLNDTSADDKRLMDQCLQDHKEYECKAMLNPNCTAAFPIKQPKVIR